MICRFDDVNAEDALSIANRLRSDGLKIEVFPELSKIGRQIAYAESIHAPVVIILGASEIASGKLTVKISPQADRISSPLRRSQSI
jgi:histidyl-tRNA synthetase